MAKISADTASQVESADGFEGRYHDLGGFTVAWESCTTDQDPAPLFVGLPDNACQCPHWGVVLDGKIIFRYTDGGEDVVEAGEAYHARPGHNPLISAGTRIIEFSPTEDLGRTMEVVLRNLAAAQTS